jgi:hypothetical protein
MLLIPTAAMAAGGNHASHHPATPRAQSGRVIPVPASWLRRTPAAGQPRHLAPASASYGGSCQIRDDNNNVGAYICGTQVLLYQWGDGHHEAFVVGIDGAVYHDFQTASGAWSGWLGFGGSATQGVFLLTATPVTFAVVGAGSNLYCQDPAATPSGWSGFFVCGSQGTVTF